MVIIIIMSSGLRKFRAVRALLSAALLLAPCPASLTCREPCSASRYRLLLSCELLELVDDTCAWTTTKRNTKNGQIIEDDYTDQHAVKGNSRMRAAVRRSQRQRERGDVHDGLIAQRTFPGFDRGSLILRALYRPHRMSKASPYSARLWVRDAPVRPIASRWESPRATLTDATGGFHRGSLSSRART